MIRLACPCEETEAHLAASHSFHGHHAFQILCFTFSMECPTPPCWREKFLQSQLTPSCPHGNQCHVSHVTHTLHTTGELKTNGSAHRRELMLADEVTCSDCWKEGKSEDQISLPQSSPCSHPLSFLLTPASCSK